MRVAKKMFNLGPHESDQGENEEEGREGRHLLQMFRFLYIFSLFYVLPRVLWWTILDFTVQSPSLGECVWLRLSWHHAIRERQSRKQCADLEG